MPTTTPQREYRKTTPPLTSTSATAQAVRLQVRKATQSCRVEHHRLHQQPQPLRRQPSQPPRRRPAGRLRLRALKAQLILLLAALLRTGAALSVRPVIDWTYPQATLL